MFSFAADIFLIFKHCRTEIEWLPGKCLTVKVLQMMPRKRSSSDIDNKPLTNTEKCESFFNFFNPPLVQDEDDEDDAPVSL